MTAFVGTDPSATRDEVALLHCSGTFQVGLLGLLRVLYATKALGDGTPRQVLHRFEAVLLAFAIASTVADGIGVERPRPGRLGDARCLLAAVDARHVLLGIRIAIAGRWHGYSRFWPMLAESWAVVVPTFALRQHRAGVVSFVHLCVGYGVLGQIVARKESSTRPARNSRRVSAIGVCGRRVGQRSAASRWPSRLWRTP